MLLFAPWAFADDVPAPPPRDERWWVGKPLADVVLTAPEGGLPEENLETLLRSKDGEPADPESIRLDLATLFQVGEFAGVSADIVPFPVYDDDGNELEGALLTYELTPAPKIARAPKVVSGPGLDPRELADVLHLDRDQVFFPEVDGPLTELRLEAWLARQGWIDPDVRIRTTEPEPGELYVVVEVDPGRPNTLQRLTFAGPIAGVATPEELRRWSRRGGLVEGRRVAPDAVARAQDEIRERLGRVRGDLLHRARGYVSARVVPAVIRGPFEELDGTRTEGVRITFGVEPGARLELAVTGLGGGGVRKAAQALGVDHRLRITRGWLDEAPERMVAWLQERGWYAATAEVSVERPADGLEVLRVDAVRGAAHTIGERPDVRLVDTAFTWGEGSPEGRAAQRTEAQNLQAVFDQASLGGIRREIYTDGEMAAAAEAARQYYVGRGHLDAEVAVGPPEIHTRPSPLNLARWVVGAPRHQRVTPQVTVTPGPVTTQQGLEVAGGADDVALDFLPEAIAARIGAPFSPQALEALARRVVEAHRAQGYVEADAKVESRAAGPLARQTLVTVDAGPKVLLRSVLTRGARRTRNHFLLQQVQVEVTLGEPVTSERLEALRTSLYDLGVFRTVSTDLLGDGNARDLLVTVDERKPWLVEGGFGLSTDQGVRLFSRVTRGNLFGMAHRVEFFGQLGLDYRSEDIRDWLPDVFNPEGRAAISYTAPRFPLQDQEIVVDLVLRERVQERTWRLDRSGVGLAIDTRLTHTRARAGVRLDHRVLDEVDFASLVEGEPWDVLLGDTPALPSPGRWQESITALLVEDRRNDPVQPTRGLLVSTNGELVPGLPWAGQPPTAFAKGELRLSGYVPLGRLTLHGAAGGGLARSLGDGLVPLEDRFRLGGTGSLRGFVRDGVGPQNETSRVSVDWPKALGPIVDYALRGDPDRWTPTGGDTTAQGTLELFVPLPALGLSAWDGYSGELFWDVGNVWFLDPDAVASTDARKALPLLRHGVGAGLQAATPIGPLQFDIGVNPQALGAAGARRALLVGELEEPSWRAHLTLGATF